MSLAFGAWAYGHVLRIVAAELERHMAGNPDAWACSAASTCTWPFPPRIKDKATRERRGRLFGETAAGHLQRREYDVALHFLRRSYATSPEEVPFSPLTRGVAVELVRKATGPLKAEAVALASEIGILPAVYRG